MHGFGSAGKATLEQDYDTEHGAITPRGMAAPPPAPPVRHDHDTSRPATIRIEAYRGPATVAAAHRPSHPAPRPAEAAPRREQNVGAAAPRRPSSRLQALMVSQGLLLNAFVLLMVFGWSAPLPSRRALLAAFAIGGIAVAVLMHLALAQARRSAPADSRHPSSVREPWRLGRGRLAVRALPAALFTAWVGLGLYALALPPTANAFQDTRPAALPTPRPAATPAATRSQATSVQAPAREAQTTAQRRFSYHP